MPPSCGVNRLPCGVASRSCGSAGREDEARGIWSCSGGTSGLGQAAPTAMGAGWTGLTLGEGGMPRVSLGVRVPLLLRAPGTGGRRRGAGADMLLSDGGLILAVMLRHRREMLLELVTALPMGSEVRVGYRSLFDYRLLVKSTERKVDWLFLFVRLSEGGVTGFGLMSGRPQQVMAGSMDG